MKGSGVSESQKTLVQKIAHKVKWQVLSVCD